jgi:glutamate-1-semialdehyde 2,1-aminomutase
MTMSSILETYVNLHPKSRALYQDALQVFPGGVTHDTRHSTPFPIFVNRAAGSRKWDVDGNEIIDYVSGHGALLLGHSHPSIVSAMRRQIESGTHFGASHELEIEWARLVQQLIPSAERIRFTSSGTEAVQMAVRLARAATGRTKLAKFEQHFHGWSDTVSGSMIPGGEALRAPGIPQPALDQQLVLPPNDAGAAAHAISESSDVAALIVEPTGAHMGKVPIDPAFLHELRDICSRRGVILIFDEVVTGFRASPGGAQSLFGVIPDLTTLAKILAGGLPGGAVAGREDLLNRIAHTEDPEWNLAERVEHPGTFNANPLSAAAGSACLQIVAQGEANAAATAAAKRLSSEMNRVLTRARVDGCVYGAATILHILLGKECIRPEDGISWRWTDDVHRSVPRMSPKATIGLKRALLNEGVDLMSDGRLIVGAEHSEEDLRLTVEAFGRAVASMQAESII